jgi:hypothetical protein
LLPVKAKGVIDRIIIKQDTVRQKNVVNYDSLDHSRDTSLHRTPLKTDTLRKRESSLKLSESHPVKEDTTSVCYRPQLAYITFSDTSNFVFSIDRSIIGRAPLAFISANRDLSENNRSVLMMSLKEGKELPVENNGSDWILPLIIFCVILLGIVRTFPGNVFRSLVSSLTFRNISESTSFETTGLFNWQATLFNLSSFISISLFGFLLLRDNNLSPLGIHGFLLWVVCLGLVITAITLRHLVCTITGNFSSEPDVFSEYLFMIYNVYRVAGIIFLLLIALIMYTSIVPAAVYFKIGIIITGLLYLLRIFRLILIFLIRHVSIFYLILYLCALEFLPVLIFVKYITGLV